MSKQSKWSQTTDQNPNINNTEVGKLLEGLQHLYAHYDNELKKNANQLDFLQQALIKLEAQKKNRRTDNNG